MLTQKLLPKHTIGVEAEEKISSLSANSIISRIAKESSKESPTLKAVFVAYRTPSIRWIQKHFLKNEQESRHIYVQAISKLYEKIHIDKLTQLNNHTGSLCNYLIGIAKYILLEELRAKARFTNLESFELNATPAYVPPDCHQMEERETQTRIQEALQKLGGTCQQILVWFYYDNFSMEIIAHRINKSAGAVRVQKLRCLDRLKKLYTGGLL